MAESVVKSCLEIALIEPERTPPPFPKSQSNIENLELNFSNNFLSAGNFP